MVCFRKTNRKEGSAASHFDFVVYEAENGRVKLATEVDST